ncbi:MAG: ABC transporter ATP-binding protein [Phycisphaerae bacterium]|nr:ABC transporter ATP-binding protein [Phycisphaerae bacterium]
MSDAIVTATHLSRDYGRFRALSDVNLTLERGRVIALLGPNGAGKSTLLHLLIGQLEPTAGGSHILGHPSRRLPQAITGRIAYMGDGEEPPGGYNARQLFQLQSQLSPFNSKRAGDFLAIQKLDPRKPFGEFSKGQKKWIRAAMILGSESDVIFMDEPAEGLDPASRIKLYEHLRRHVSDCDSLAVVATHIINDIETVADEVIILKRGKVLVHEDLEDIREQVRELFVPETERVPDFALSAETLGSQAVSGGTRFWMKADKMDTASLAAAITVRPVNLEAFYLSVAEYNHSQAHREIQK